MATFQSLTPAQKAFVQSLATQAYGSRSGEKTSGGTGNMGLVEIGGKMRVFKCNTHHDQVQTVANSKNAALKRASDSLRETMMKIGRDAGVNEGELRRLLGLADKKGRAIVEPKSLLTRKIVAKFVTILVGSDRAEENNVWAAASRDHTKSTANMRFGAMFAQKNGVPSEFNDGYERFSSETTYGRDNFPPLEQADVTDKNGVTLHSYTQTGALGKTFAKKMTELCVNSYKGVVVKEIVEPMSTMFANISQGVSISCGKTELTVEENEKDGSQATRQTATNRINTALATYFGEDSEFRLLAVTLVNSVFNMAYLAKVLAHNGTGVGYFPSPERAGPNVQRKISIDANSDGSVVIKARQTYVPVCMIKDNLVVPGSVKDDESSVTEEYELRLTKLGKNDDRPGGNVVKVGDSDFRIDIDPEKCSITAKVFTD